MLNKIKLNVLVGNSLLARLPMQPAGISAWDILSASTDALRSQERET